MKASRDAAPAPEKRLATAMAKAALVGITVHRIQGDFGTEYLATQWAVTRRFADLQSLEQWLAHVIAASGTRAPA